MQNMFAKDGPWATPWMEAVLPQVLRVVEHNPDRTLFTRFIPPTVDEPSPGRWEAYWRKWSQLRRGVIDDALLELLPPLQKFTPPAPVFDKRVYSAFADGRLHPFLQEKEIDTLIVTGSETDVCVLSSALSAIDLGYRVVIVRDAICGSADETHDALVRVYECRFDLQIVLSNVDEVLEAWA